MEQHELRARRAAAQLLSGPRAASAPDVVRRLLAIQAQDPRAARLAIRARSTGLDAAVVDRELARGTLVVGWLLRGTLHLVCREDYHWLLALTPRTRLVANRRRLREEGVSVDEADRAVELVRHALADEGPLTRAELADRLAARGIHSEGQAAHHLLMLAALHGFVVLGPPRGGRQAFVLAADWLGPAPEVDRDAALAELAERYLAGHAPAGPDDLARWAGLPLRDARAAMALAPDRAGRAASIPVPRLLPAFDPYLLGWKDRTFAVPAEHARRVHPGGGVLRPVATLAGLAVGTWRLRRGDVELAPFAPLGRDEAAKLEEDAADVVRFEAARS